MADKLLLRAGSLSKQDFLCHKENPKKLTKIIVKKSTRWSPCFIKKNSTKTEYTLILLKRLLDILRKNMLENMTY
jgi:hypothetical protein